MVAQLVLVLAGEAQLISFGWTLFAECLILPCLVGLVSSIGAPRVSRLIRAALRQGAGNAWGSIAIVMLLSLGLSVVITMIRTPHPLVHDEFSYLLAADMFVGGRVAMPMHPMWEHFETFHVLLQPSYASKYPPAQGAFLALGQLLGSPIIGVWITTSLAAGASCWMLQGWMPRRWAFLGGLLVCISYTVLIRWGQSYWGGAPAMIGGALLCGGYVRHAKRAGLAATTAMLLGAAMFATTRPYEGGVLCIVVAVHIAAQAYCNGLWRERKYWTRFAAPGIAGSCLLLAGLGTYNHAITGHWTDFPHANYHRQYGATPVFLFQSPPPEPAYRHKVLREFWTGWGAESYRQQQNLAAYLSIRSKPFVGLIFSFWGLSLGVPLLLSYSVRKRQGVSFAVMGVGLVLLASAFVPWAQRHYLAPALPLAYLLITQVLRQFYGARSPGKSRLPAFATACLASALAALVLRTTYEIRKPDHWGAERARIERELMERSGDDLVVVRYDKNHQNLDEWVYNRADIDHSAVVWAREMSSAKNVELLNYYPNRRHWLLLADAKPPRLIEHSTPVRNQAQGPIKGAAEDDEPAAK